MVVVFYLVSSHLLFLPNIWLTKCEGKHYFTYLLSWGWSWPPPEIIARDKKSLQSASFDVNTWIVRRRRQASAWSCLKYSTAISRICHATQEAALRFWLFLIIRWCLVASCWSEQEGGGDTAVISLNILSQARNTILTSLSKHREISFTAQTLDLGSLGEIW